VSERIEFNVNETVRVRLTDRGRDILRAYWAESTLPGREPYSPRISDDGWYDTQLWNVMHVFGPHVRLGFDVPFDTTIELVVRPKVPA
jgi:hypothetical protein